MRLVRLNAVLDRTGLSRSTVYELMGRGEFPRPTKIYSGGRANVWSDHEIDAWIEARIAERECEPA